MDPNLSTYGLHARNDLGSILQKRKGKGKNKEEAAGETAEMPFNRLYTTVRPGKLTSRRRTHAAIRSRPVADLEWKRRRSTAFPVAKKALVLPAPLQSPV